MREREFIDYRRMSNTSQTLEYNGRFSKFKKLSVIKNTTNVIQISQSLSYKVYSIYLLANICHNRIVHSCSGYIRHYTLDDLLCYEYDIKDFSVKWKYKRDQR